MTARASRTYTLLLGIGAAGVVIWIATRVGDYSTWRYWAALGLLAGAAAVILVGWIAAVGEPHSNWFRNHFSSWSHDIGIRSFVDHMTQYVSVMAFGFGGLLASAPGAVRHRRPVHAPAAVAEPGPFAAGREQPIGTIPAQRPLIGRG